MKALIQTGSSLSACGHAQAGGRVPVPHEKRFLINMPSWDRLYIDFFNELGGNRVWFQIDKVHPTAAGSAKMAEVVWTAINPGN